ncbi:GNAT family N-acetyltransferase [Rouxiella chamberiensis]|uniref:GNAT family N-acetyltransferase n=1 Tax=Rouxiella chamberiensis TaxID=1513468 RepID=A0ABY7HMT7_9GAMM|nr:GNAT family N-acetyltransferase [Rouxiella chamberiensis]WAT00695.1 GNAT family N-acetyltransferase [Rouxiella chamberiensis]
MSEQGKPVIRPLTFADQAQWEGLWKEYLDFYQTTLNDAIVKTTFQRLASEEYAAMFGYVAEQDGKLVGIVNCINHDHGWRLEQVVYLQDLYVSSQARKTGVGQALIEAVYRYADETGKGNVYWMTQESNQTARKLYDRVGVHTDFIKYQR